jgi:hypothetical protein
MNATTLSDAVSRESRTSLLSMQVDGETCMVRTATVWPIAEVLAFEDLIDGVTTDSVDADMDPGLIADLLDSRMIAPPRPRHRRQKSVSSRAAFYTGS